MRLTVPQDLAIRAPYDDAAAEAMQATGPSTLHMSHRWISSEVQVLVIFTVSVPSAGPPFWHVSMGVKVRDVGTMLMVGLEKRMRRRLKEIGEDVLKGVGAPPDGDEWDIGEKALHLMRPLTVEEIEFMRAPRV